MRRNKFRLNKSHPSHYELSELSEAMKKGWPMIKYLITIVIPASFIMGYCTGKDNGFQGGINYCVEQGSYLESNAQLEPHNFNIDPLLKKKLQDSNLERSVELYFQNKGLQ